MRFELAGKTAVSKNNLTYLKVDDQMIHQLFPLLPQNDLLQKPDYFGVEGVGAHISLIYPQEQILIEESDLNQVYDFTIKGFCKAVLGAKTYYVLRVKSDALVALRQQYGLPEYCCFQSYAVDFHMTIGVEI